MSYPATFLQDKDQPLIGGVFVELATVDSSNNYAMAMAHDGKAIHGNVFFAHHQTAGRGQRDKKWSANKGENIMMSIVLQPEQLPVNNQFFLSASIALGCYDLLNIYFPGNIFIKWPNDLYIRDRKAGGILIENIISGGKWKYAIAGIGININQTGFDNNLPNPVSLKLITGKTFHIIELAKELCMYIDKRYTQLISGSAKKIMADYNSSLYKRNEKAKLKKGSQVFETTIKEVNAHGNLITYDAMERSFGFGEVEWVK
ncbi:MAG TPA: biotin--[acetyl-CoA-carboxylase] ligase [Puia sp.]|nr:biotin--[acetyl-CoA-carboxylase] ligase [Puia sp.]